MSKFLSRKTVANFQTEDPATKKDTSSILGTRWGPGTRLSDIQYNAFYYYTMVDPRTQHEACRLAGISRMTGRALEDEFYGPLKKTQRPVRHRKPPVPKQKRSFLDPSVRSEPVAKLEEFLSRTIIGQPAVITALVSTYEMFLAGLAPVEQPAGNFFFLGPTGTGKTLSVEAMAAGLKYLNAPGATGTITKIDCGEFQDSHEICKLLGSGPGYLGHRETPAILKQSNFPVVAGGLSLLLFDEIEKAAGAVAKLLLGILDKACVTLGDNTKTSFKNTFIFMTSNIAADKMQALFTGGIGFANQGRPDQIEKMGLAGLKKQFSPEFFNRLDRANIVTFNPLTESHISQILELELDKVRDRVMLGSPPGPLITFTKAAKTLLTTEGFDPQYGARPLVQTIKYRILTPLAAIIASGQVKGPEEIVVDVVEGKVVFEKVGKKNWLKELVS